MGLNIKDIIKDNKKVLLPVAGLLLAILVLGVYASQSDSLFLDDGTGTTIGDTPTTSKKTYISAPAMQISSGKDYQATISTNYGAINVDLYENFAPKTVNNFVFLSKDGFYDGLTFHRVIKNFVIQGGDPLGNGKGGPGYTFSDEISNSNRVFKPYVLAMANSGANTNGSQFFITTRNFSDATLNGKYTIFGEVKSGFNVVDQIESVSVDKNYKPTTTVTILGITISEN